MYGGSYTECVTKPACVLKAYGRFACEALSITAVRCWSGRMHVVLCRRLNNGVSAHWVVLDLDP